MAWPIVVVASGGTPVTEAANGLGTPVSIAADGFGFAVTIVASGGMPVVGSGGSAPTFKISAVGSDSNDGKTDATAWASIAHVNAQTFAAGTTIQFRGGDTFSGSIALTTTNAPSGRITLTSYGTGKATVSSSAVAAFTALDVPNIGLNNLIFVGSGNTVNGTDGVVIENDTSAKIAGPTISNCDISGYGQNGIRLSALNDAGFDGYTIAGCSIHDCTGKAGALTAGVHVSAIASPIGNVIGTHTNGLISGNALFNLNGYAGASNWTGTGIWTQACSATVITGNIIHDIGANSNSGSGPGGISPNDCDGITIQFNEIYRVFTGNGIDGDGIDFDGNVRNSIAQYNYVHDCDGWGFFAFSYTGTWQNNTYRFNISAWNGLGQIMIQESGANILSCFVHNNITFGAKGIVSARNSGSITALFADNDVYGLAFSADPIIQVDNPSSQTFAGNNYFGDLGFAWNGTTYDDFASWQAASGQEKISGVNVGHSVEPQLVAAGFHDVIGGYVPNSLRQYQLQATSPMIGAGVDITAQYGIDIGPHDFFGVPITSAAKLIGAGQQVAWSGAASATTAEATAALSRMTIPSVATQQQVNALISRMVIHGLYAKSDALYKLASDTSTNALLNLISSNYPLTPSGTITFTTNKGYQSDGATGILNSTFNPATAVGAKYTLNSAAYFANTTNSRADGNYYAPVGGGDGTNSAYAFLAAGLADGIGQGSVYQINDTETWFNSGAFPTNTQGIWVVTRTGATAAAAYQNLTKLATTATVSSALPNVNFCVAGAADDPDPDFSLDQVSHAGFMSGLTDEDQFYLASIINADATALGINAF